MRHSRPSASRKHNTLKDCQSHDPTVSDTVLAHKMVRSKQMVADQIDIGTLTSEDANLNNVAIRGQTQFPDNFHEQLNDHFTRVGQPMRAPRLSVESATVQNMFCVKGHSNVENLSADGCIDARGNFHCFGTAHFYGPVQMHGSFEVDHKTPNHTTSLLRHMTEPVPTIIPVSSTSSVSTFVPPPPERPIARPTIQENNIPVQTFQCRQLHADQIKVKESLDVRQVQVQRLLTHTHEAKEITSQTIQTETLSAEALRSSHAQIDQLDVDSKFTTPSIQTQHIQTFDIDANLVKAKTIDCSEKVLAPKLQVKQLDVTKSAQLEDVLVKKSLSVGGLTTMESMQTMGPMTTHDNVRHNGTFSVSDRIESEPGRPIQIKQSVQFHRPTGHSNYQYFIFNTQQTSASKPYRLDIHDETSVLIIDSDVLNILSLDIRLPANPLKGQTITISTNPSISNVQIKGSIPVNNGIAAMSMGSFVTYLYVQEPNKWFRIG